MGKGPFRLREGVSGDGIAVCCDWTTKDGEEVMVDKGRGGKRSAGRGLMSLSTLFPKAEE
jgi:hypothetical protein